MANKLIIIGNGFDLAHGLKTSYSDFILWYLTNAYNTFVLNRHYDDKLLKFKIYRSLPQRGFASIKELKEYLTSQGIYPEIKYDFFSKLLGHFNELNWVDIESKYYEELLIIYRIIESEQFRENKSLTSQLYRLNECFNIIKVKLVEYLNTIEINNDIVNDEIKKHFLSIFPKNREIKNYERDHYDTTLILNFNYTSTVDLYTTNLGGFDFDTDADKVIHIHGKLNDDKNPIIFGYGDETDKYYKEIERLNNNNFLKNFKSFSYFKTQNYKQLNTFLYQSREGFDVFVMGHSCGLSDKVLLNNVFEHDNCRSIKLFYYDKGNNQNDFFDKTIEISRHFSSEAKGKMRTMILPPESNGSVPLIKHKTNK